MPQRKVYYTSPVKRTLDRLQNPSSHCSKHHIQSGFAKLFEPHMQGYGKTS